MYISVYTKRKLEFPILVNLYEITRPTSSTNSITTERIAILRLIKYRRNDQTALFIGMEDRAQGRAHPERCENLRNSQMDEFDSFIHLIAKHNSAYNHDLH